MMGIAPAETKKMTMWEFQAVADYWIEAHDPGDRDEPGGRLNKEEKDEIWAWMQEEGHVGRMKGNGAGH